MLVVVEVPGDVLCAPVGGISNEEVPNSNITASASTPTPSKFTGNARAVVVGVGSWVNLAAGVCVGSAWIAV